MYKISKISLASFKTLRKFYLKLYEFVHETDSPEELKQIKEELKAAGYRYCTETRITKGFNGAKIYWRVYRRKDGVVPNYPSL